VYLDKSFQLIVPVKAGFYVGNVFKRINEFCGDIDDINVHKNTLTFIKNENLCLKNVYLQIFDI